jgi:hypothetical protein
MTYLIAFMVLQGQPAPVAQSAVDVSKEWLTAYARHDGAVLRRWSIFPLVVEGFQYNDRPETNICDRVPGMTRNPTTSEIRVSAETEAGAETMLACVFADNSTHEWVKGSSDRTFVGKVRLLKNPAQAGRRLARYRKKMLPLAKTRTFVEAVTSQDGVTLTALVVLGRTPSGSFGVESVHIDFLFEE